MPPAQGSGPHPPAERWVLLSGRSFPPASPGGKRSPPAGVPPLAQPFRKVRSPQASFPAAGQFEQLWTFPALPLPADLRQTGPPLFRRSAPPPRPAEPANVCGRSWERYAAFFSVSFLGPPGRRDTGPRGLPLQSSRRPFAAGADRTGAVPGDSEVRLRPRRSVPPLPPGRFGPACETTDCTSAGSGQSWRKAAPTDRPGECGPAHGAAGT